MHRRKLSKSGIERFGAAVNVVAVVCQGKLPPGLYTRTRKT